MTPSIVLSRGINLPRFLVFLSRTALDTNGKVLINYEGILRLSVCVLSVWEITYSYNNKHYVLVPVSDLNALYAYTTVYCCAE